jgi:oligoribonuclease NrnB/cAMP/cGMP phosphodiesterase (DHH superfamily)
MSKTCVIFHSYDLDGWMSAAIVKLWYTDHVKVGKFTALDSIDFIGYNYGQPIPDLSGYDRVVMCDISFPKEEMLKLWETKGLNFIWIDHHVSAIKEMENAHENIISGAYPIQGLRNVKFAACELTWQYFFPDEPMPKAIEYLGIYDSWRNEDKELWNSIIMPFQYGMRLYTNSFESFPIEVLTSDNEIPETIKTGYIVLHYQNQQNEKSCKISAFEREFEGLRAIMLNNGGANSQLFQSVYDESKHDIMMSFVYTGKHWTFSIYSIKPNIDCSVLAKKHGGGGHKGAAGFQTSHEQFLEIIK